MGATAPYYTGRNALEPLRVIGHKAREDDHTEGADHKVHHGTLHPPIHHAGKDDADQPMKSKLPMRDRSTWVVYPAIAMMANVPAVMTNTWAKLPIE